MLLFFFSQIQGAELGAACVEVRCAASQILLPQAKGFRDVERDHAVAVNHLRNLVLGCNLHQFREGGNKGKQRPKRVLADAIGDPGHKDGNDAKSKVDGVVDSVNVEARHEQAKGVAKA